MKPVETLKELQDVAATARGDFSAVCVDAPFTVSLAGCFCTAPENYEGGFR